MDRAITFHADLSDGLNRRGIHLDEIKRMIKTIPWQTTDHGTRFHVSGPSFEVHCVSEEDEVFVDNVFLNEGRKTTFILFDVDGTLLSSHGVGRAAISSALARVYGTEGPMDTYPFSGKLDPNIIRELMAQAGFSDSVIEKGLQSCLQYYIEELSARMTPRKVTLKPGIRELIAHLHARPHTYLALCTGNIPEGARLKTRMAGLDDYFLTGAFGNDALDRNGLPPVAVRRLQHRLLIRGIPHRTIVIGDAPVDIQSAHHNRNLSVAVATGAHSREELSVYQPHLLVDSFADPSPFFKWMEEILEES
ncbi:MAG TPA: HAD family hydrolase [Thermoanaerobaculia bacterium]|nr:HAD family hydrolase [Thermoanaerobaculia bacterium]HUM29300.1 HAD family hydrolase [Thermoanaerobaculia bacterium]HXK67742.1 HAD family hydrolase [Thermoanaerobaculia bacterium]